MYLGEKLIKREPFRWGIVGGGKTSQVGYKHRLGAMRDNTSFVLTAAAFDVDAERCKEFGRNLCMDEDRCYPDYKTMFEAEAKREDGIEVVDVATPNFLHYEVTKAALEAGLHVICEKPLFFEAEQGEEIKKLAEEKGKIVAVTYGFSGFELLQQMRAMVTSGKLGKIVGIQSNYAIAKPHEYFDVEWHTKKGSGPLLINAIHDFDDLNFVTGMKPTKVYAAARNTIRGNEVEDSVSAVVEYEGGVTASYFVSDGTPGPWNYDLAAEENTFFTMCPGENSMRVFGTKGSFGFPNMDLYYQDDDAYGWLQPIKHEHFDVEKNDPMTAELEHFVDLCLGRETTPRCTGDNALDTLKVINAIQKSAEDETPVKL